MKLAITGGAGFLGCHLCNAFTDNYEEISILDIAPINFKEYPKNAKYINIDVRDSERLNRVLNRVDTVIHAAAALPLWRKKDIFDINVRGTQNVLESAVKNNIEKVVYVSSTAVYGVPKKHPIYEDDPLVGVGPYGESKIRAEKICSGYRKKGLCVPIVRPKSFIGIGRLGVFQILYDWVESGKKIPIIGNGKNRYQLLEVEDLTDIISLLIAASFDKANDTFNVGTDKFNTVLEDLGSLCDYAGTGARVLPTPAWVVKSLLAFFELINLSPLYKWIYGTADKDSFVSIEKAKDRFGWLPKYSNSEALIKSYRWYVEHKDELSGTGITHRVAWSQGILALLKRFL